MLQKSSSTSLLWLNNRRCAQTLFHFVQTHYLSLSLFRSHPLVYSLSHTLTLKKNHLNDDSTFGVPKFWGNMEKNETNYRYAACHYGWKSNGNSTSIHRINGKVAIKTFYCRFFRSMSTTPFVDTLFSFEIDSQRNWNMVSMIKLNWQSTKIIIHNFLSLAMQSNRMKLLIGGWNFATNFATNCDCIHRTINIFGNFDIERIHKTDSPNEKVWLQKNYLADLSDSWQQ